MNCVGIDHYNTAIKCKVNSWMKCIIYIKSCCGLCTAIKPVYPYFFNSSRTSDSGFVFGTTKLECSMSHLNRESHVILKEKISYCVFKITMINYGSSRKFKETDK